MIRREIAASDSIGMLGRDVWETRHSIVRLTTHFATIKSIAQPASSNHRRSSIDDRFFSKDPNRRLQKNEAPNSFVTVILLESE